MIVILTPPFSLVHYLLPLTVRKDGYWADWNEFSTLCNELIIDAECLEANDPMEHFTNLVIHIA